MPGGEGQNWIVDVDGQRQTFASEREARFISVDASLPREILIEGAGGNIRRAQSLWPGRENNRFLVFSAATGALKFAACLGEEVHLEPGDYTLLLRFSPDNLSEPPERIVEDPIVYRVALLLRPAERLELRRGPAQAVIQADAQPMLYWEGLSLTSNEGRELFSSVGLSLRVLVPDEILNDEVSEFVIRLSPGGLGDGTEVYFSVDETGQTTIDLEELAATNKWRAGVGRFLAELRRSGQVGTSGYSMTQLLNAAARRLDCSANCSSGCRNCLCDYSNQRNWDQFIRLPVLEWLQSIEQKDRGINFGAKEIRWQKPSLSGLTNRLQNVPEIHSVSERLDGLEAEDDAARSELLGWLHAGKKVTIHLTSDLQKGKGALQNARLLTTYRYLHRLHMPRGLQHDEDTRLP